MTIEPSRRDRSDGAVRLGACTDIGRVRSENQDSYGVYPPQRPALFVVADGMGGHEDGGVASRLAVRVLAEHFSSASGTIDQRLQSALAAANAAVWARASAARQLRPMGTTCTVLGIEDGQVWLVHVGDSRAYRIAGDAIEQVSADHTVAAELAAGGLLSPSEAARHPYRHALTRALGVSPDVEPEVQHIGTVRPGDRFMLCSDGLAEVPLEEVRQTVTMYPPQEAAERLVARANLLGGSDNVTVLVIEPIPAS